MVHGFGLVLIRCLSLLCTLTCWCSIAIAQSPSPAPVASSGGPGARLTSRGRIMVAGQVSGFWSDDRPTAYGSYPTWTVHADPALTYFVWDNIGFGGVLTGSYSRGELFGRGGFIERALGLAGVCVWNVPLRGRVSLMLRNVLGYSYGWSDLSTAVALGFRDLGPSAALPASADPSSTATVRQRDERHSLRISTSLPIVYALSESVGVGAGPTLSYEFVVRGTREWSGQGLGSLPTERFRDSRIQVGISVGVYASF